MNCPICNIPLIMSERQGVEIDFCSQCRGVWLDRGELDKIIDQSAASQAGPSPRLTEFRDQDRDRQNDRGQDRDYRDDRRDDRRRDYDDDDDRYRGKRKKRDSFLSDLFDF